MKWVPFRGYYNSLWWLELEKWEADSTTGSIREAHFKVWLFLTLEESRRDLVRFSKYTCFLSCMPQMVP